jgi:hypothetical protein
MFQYKIKLQTDLRFLPLEKLEADVSFMMIEKIFSSQIFPSATPCDNSENEQWTLQVEIQAV